MCVARVFPPCMAVGSMWVVGALPPCVAGGTMCVEGLLPPCVATGPAWLVTMGGGNWLMIVYMNMLGPLTKLWVTGCDVEMGPLAKVRTENGSGFAVAMGLDGAVWRYGPDRYGSESESEAVWSSDGVGDR